MKFRNENELQLAKVELAYKRSEEERYIVLTIREIGEMFRPANIAKRLYRKITATPEFKKIIIPVAFAAGAGMVLAQSKRGEKPAGKIKNIVNGVVDEVIDNYEYKIRAVTLAIIKNIFPGSVVVKNKTESFTSVSA